MVDQPRDWRLIVALSLLGTTAVAMLYSDFRRIRDLEVVNAAMSAAMQQQGGAMARYDAALHNLQTVAATHDDEIRAVREEVLRMRLAAKVREVNADAPADVIAAGIAKAAEANDLSPWLVYAVAKVESHFHVNARGGQGERGLMQLMPATARSVGLNWSRADDIDANLTAGARYLRQLLKQHDGSIWRALLAYNGGGNATYPKLVMVNLHAEVQ